MMSTKNFHFKYKDKKKKKKKIKGKGWKTHHSDDDQKKAR